MSLQTMSSCPRALRVPGPFLQSSKSEQHRLLCQVPRSRATSRQGRAAAGAAAAAAAAPPATGSVFLWRSPLVGWEGLEGLLGQSLFPSQLALHEGIVLCTPAGGSGSGGKGDGEVLRVACYDFLPEAPTDPDTVRALLLGGSVPGLTRVRPLVGVPRLRCALLGHTRLSDPHGAAEAFQRDWDPTLRLLRRDCRQHSRRLARQLLGPGVVL